MTHRSEQEMRAAADQILGRDLADVMRTGKDADVELPDSTAPVMVSRSLRLPLDMEQRIKAAAAEHGVTTSALIRQWIELGLASAEADKPISLADALRALAALPRRGSSTAA